MTNNTHPITLALDATFDTIETMVQIAILIQHPDVTTPAKLLTACALASLADAAQTLYNLAQELQKEGTLP